MNKLLIYLAGQVSPEFIQIILSFMRIAIGILTIGHGLPKITGGWGTWVFLGKTMQNLGIYFFPAMWGFFAACTEFFGGIALVLGFGTRIACVLLTLMMYVAFLMHRANKDPFSVYSFSLTMIVIFIGYFFIGSGKISLDYYLTK